MCKVYFISDYHFGHSNVIEFENRLRARVLGVNTIQEHDLLLIERTLQTVNKRDTLWVLGDNGSVETTYSMFNECLSSRIHYIPGNHDSRSQIAKLSSLDNVNVSGITKYKGYWLTHSPMHPQELRGKGNIHGHCHSKVIRDPAYTCVSIENTAGYPICGQDIVKGEFTTHNNFIY